MEKFLLTVFAPLLLLASVSVRGDLYTGEVVIPSQSEYDRNEAIPEALIQVLQKLSGQRELPISPALDNALDNSGQLLHSFRYENVVRRGADGVATEELRLIARFMQSEVDTVVQRLGLPRWQQQRPTLQIWVVVDDGRNRQLKPVEYEYAWEAMKDIAALRGLPVSWPELDEEEAELIDLRLVWGGFTDYLIERGAPGDGVAIVAARREGPRWSLRWTMAADERVWYWRNEDRELLFALLEGVHRMTDQISSAKAIAPSEQRQWSVEVTVGALDSALDYARCLDYLQNLSLVTSVEIRGAEPGRVHFHLQLNAAPEHLDEAFNRGSTLISSASGTGLEYDFLP